ncbi:MAG: hypothetical protein IJV17_04430, partial [Prevotella sp.]|nr:hypothetical protein [Prevotella sp.]
MKKKLLSFLSLVAIGVLAFAATQASRRATTTLWENAEGVAVNWNGDVTVAKDKLTSLKIGDIITVTIKDVVAGATKDNWNAQVSLREGWWNEVEADVAVAEADTKAEFTVTGDILKLIQARGLMISGKGFKATKIEASDGEYTGSENSIWIGNSTAKPTLSKYHFIMAHGGYKEESVWKNGVKAGDIIRVKATTNADATGDKYFVLSYSGEDTSWSWKNYEGMDAVTTTTGFDFVVTEGNIEQIRTDGIILNQNGYIITQVELITPPTDITISPATGANISEALATATTGIDKVGNITINLSAGDYTLSDAIVAGAGAVTINGNGATIDASGCVVTTGEGESATTSAAPFIQMSATPGVAANEAGGYPIDGIT